MQKRSPHRNLILEAESGRASRGALLDRYVTMLVGCPPCYELDQRLRLVGKAVRRDFYSAQQLVTLENGAVIVAYIEPERPIEQGGKALRGQCTQPAAGTGIGHYRNDDVGFAGVGDDLGDTLPGKAVVAREHHDVSCGCGPGAALVRAAEPEVDRVVENPDAGVRDRQRLHPLQGAIGAGVVDEDDFVIVPPAHRRTHRADRGANVILLVEARNDETECR